MTRFTRRAALGGLLGLALLSAACAGGVTRPADLDLARTLATRDGHYRVTVTPGLDPVKINQTHTWTVRVETAEGKPVDDAVVRVDGDMPEHRHGLPTKPQVTRSLGNGEYLVEGMRFQMGGWWVVDVDVEAGGQADAVRFNLVLA